MFTGNISDVGLWKCGKGRAFTHKLNYSFTKKRFWYNNKDEGIENSK